jgi:hypothetical protein
LKARAFKLHLRGGTEDLAAGAVALKRSTRSQVGYWGGIEYQPSQVRPLLVQQADLMGSIDGRQDVTAVGHFR